MLGRYLLFINRVCFSYEDQGLVVRTELAMSVGKDRRLNILEYVKQTRLMNSLLCATVNFADNLLKIFGIYQEFAKRVFQEYELETFFHSF